MSMPGDTLRVVRRALAGAFDVLAELGRDDDGTIAWLARETKSGALVALQAHADAADHPRHVSVDIRRTLDAAVPSIATRCPACDASVRNWARFCADCGNNLGTREAQCTGIAVPAPNEFELIGEMPRAEGGEPVTFARHTDTSVIVTVRTHPAPTGSPPLLRATRALPAAAENNAPDPSGSSAPDPRVTTREAELPENPIPDASDLSSALDGEETPAAGAATGTQPLRCAMCDSEYPPGTRFCPIDGSSLMSAATRSDLVGRVIAGRYRVLRQLGSGATGRVYLAEHVRIGRLCAVKIINPALREDPEAVGRFGREAAHTSRIDHPNIATVHDFGETADGLVYLAMEYVEGVPLSGLLSNESPFPPARAIAICSDIASALAAAHQIGIVHRDLKPDNVIITIRGGAEVAKLIDFGIARAIQASESQQLTRTGYVIGTPRYMSPEQLSGDTLDGRSDLFSLGCILYEMLVGEPAFDSSMSEIVIARRFAPEPPSAQSRNPAVPDALERIIARAMARSPDDRFASAGEMRAALALVQFDTPDPSPQAVPGLEPSVLTERVGRRAVRRNRFDTARRFARKHASAAGVTAPAVVLSLTVIAWAASRAGSAGQAGTPADTLDPQSTAQRVVPPDTAGAAPGDQAGAIEPLLGGAVAVETLSVAAHRESGAAPARPRVLERPLTTTPDRGSQAGSAVGGDRAPPASPDSAAQGVDAPSIVAAAPPQALVDRIIERLAGAEQAGTLGDYPVAFRMLDAAQEQIHAARVMFPHAAAVEDLQGRLAKLLVLTVRACEEIRRVRIDLGLRAPECRTDGGR
ncbi:MAG: protein kinase [Gemmatimonadetes bacterium]|nr:protein kinase [Gemmatimonadota bacterium]